MFKKYTTKDGMLINGVYSLDRSKNGMWWIGTGAGLQRFDGYHFENWTEAMEKTTVANMGVQTVFEDSKTNVWVFNFGTQYYFAAGSKKYRVVTTDTLMNIEPPKIYLMPVMEKAGRIWCFQGNTGLYGINQQTKKIDSIIPAVFNPGISAMGSITIPFFGIDEKGKAWITQDYSDSNYLVQFKPGEAIKIKSLPVNKYGRVKAYIPLGGNRFLFLSTAYTAVCIGDDMENPVKILSTENIPGNFIRKFCYERLKVYNKGSIIFGGEKGLYEYIPSTTTLQPYITSVYPQLNLSRQFLFALKEDTRGNIWIGRDASDGLLIFYPGKLKFKFLKAPQQYFNIVYSLAADEKGKLVAAGYQKGLNIFDNAGNWIKYIQLPATEDGLSPSMRSMNFIDSNHLVMKSLYGKMAVLNTDNYTLKDISSLLPGHVAEQRNAFDAGFVKTEENKLLFVHGNYVLQIIKKNEKYAIELIDSLMKVDRITTITVTPGRETMLGTTEGCYLKSENKWKLIAATGKLYIKHVAFDSERTLWIATAAGIYLVKKNRIIKTYNAASGLLNDFIYGILFDNEGNAWYSCNRGLGCIKKNGNVKFFTEAAGLQGDEFDTQSFWKGADGKLHFGGTNGISSFFPKEVLQSEIPGKAILSELLVNGSNYPVNGRIEDLSALDLPVNQNALTFSFSLSDFIDPDYNVYQVKMDGFDNDWVMLKDVHTTRYLLPYGSYKLHIKGSNDGSNWSEEFLLPITIHPSWWQTGWFKWLVGLLIIGLSVGAVWYYNKRRAFNLRQQLQLQEVMQNERERISRDLHDNIGAYSSAMIANTDYLEQTVSDNESRERVLYLKENARNILSTIRETIWLLNSKNLTVSGFTEGFITYCTNILRNYEGIEIEFKEDIERNKNLSPAVAINLLRILQEVVQNTVKHSKATKINCFIKSDEQLTIIIADNGDGFDTMGKSYGNGLRNMKYRAAEINFNLAINSKPRNGTEITLTGKI